jgi:hypothetical protein
VHFLVHGEADGNVENLIQFQDRDCVGLIRFVRFQELFWIELFANQNMEHLAAAGRSLTHDLRVVNVELGFAIASVAVVLQKGRRELSER